MWNIHVSTEIYTSHEHIGLVHDLKYHPSFQYVTSPFTADAIVDTPVTRVVAESKENQLLGATLYSNGDTFVVRLITHGGDMLRCTKGSLIALFFMCTCMEVKDAVYQ